MPNYKIFDFELFTLSYRELFTLSYRVCSKLQVGIFNLFRLPLEQKIHFLEHGSLNLVVDNVNNKTVIRRDEVIDQANERGEKGCLSRL